MKASVGDRIVTASGVVGGAVRDGVVVELRHDDGSPPYLVEWGDTGERTLVYPGSDSYVEHVPGAENGGGTDTTKVWRVQVSVVESEGRTTAEAVLVAGPPEHVRTVGRARRDPHDTDIPLIGDEIAVGRALRRLADRLLDDAEADIESSTGVPAHVHL
ncbi:dsRBD fold-containing protein [Cellulosimicrobium cellulans]|uniref:dsRBD fold-containing protein n=1 Tax=Cellulosimicrobium cellulans TaxID=1710 RepID=UPI0008494CCE|nr:dsRBD fold-containing protein [Cellulosimicrobium cellulans]